MYTPPLCFLRYECSKPYFTHGLQSVALPQVGAPPPQCFKILAKYQILYVLQGGSPTRGGRPTMLVFTMFARFYSYLRKSTGKPLTPPPPPGEAPIVL